MIHDSCTGTAGMKGAQEEAWAVAKKGTQTFEQPCNFNICRRLRAPGSTSRGVVSF